MKNPFALPGPETLGHPIFLPMKKKGFGNPHGSYSWEDYETDMKRLHPVRAWVRYSLKPFYWGSTVRPVKEAIYWVKCHALPQHRYHLLDLRDKHKDGYKYGYRDPVTRVMQAMFAVLVDYVEYERPELAKEVYTPDPLDDGDPYETNACVEAWNKANAEVHALYRWWTVDRFVEKESDRSSEARQRITDKEDEMMRRVIAVRQYLWT